jgi:hypothetical protein
MRSGGIERGWVGVPRRYMDPGKSKTEDRIRCVCVRNTGPPSDRPNSEDDKNRGDLDHPNLREYDDCEPDSVSCSFLRTF